MRGKPKEYSLDELQLKLSEFEYFTNIRPSRDGVVFDYKGVSYVIFSRNSESKMYEIWDENVNLVVANSCSVDRLIANFLETN